MARFLTSDGVSLHYVDHGSGLPVLCLSGLTRNSSDFDYVAPSLGDVRMIAMDYRGRGRSDWADFETYTVAQEARDALALLDHLEIPAAAILGTSRGGIIAMVLAATAGDRLIGACLNDIGPELAEDGLTDIMGYLGRSPTQRSYEEAALMRAELMPGFTGVPQERWEAEVRKHYKETPGGLRINYDPRLRDAVEAAGAQPAPDLWPLFDALAGKPTALIRGANSNLLTAETAAKMRARRPDMIFADVPDRGHVPFLDEPEAVAVIRRWLEACQ